MTTEPETQPVIHIGHIPEDWTAAFRTGHILMVPTDFRSRIISTEDIKAIVAGFYGPEPIQADAIDHLSNLSRALGEAGYIIREFPVGSVEIAQEPATQDAANALERYHERLATLREAAEEEGIEWSEASQQDFQAFVTGNPGWRKGSVVLMENGNLRTVWDDEHDDDRHVALQFLGGGQVQYVMFKLRPGARQASRVAGNDTFDGIKRQIAAFDLNPLVYA